MLDLKSFVSSVLFYGTLINGLIMGWRMRSCVQDPLVRVYISNNNNNKRGMTLFQLYVEVPNIQ